MSEAPPIEDDDDGGPAQGGAGGLPGWVMTFADLMSLLMCFFVLLLSFSQMDLSKFKKIAGSMDQAFGVQEIVAYEIPKGTSVIAQEFSPGKPQPTSLNDIRQTTMRDMQNTLEFDEIRTSGDIKQKDKYKNSKPQKSENETDESDSGTAGKAAEIAGELVNEIMDGVVEVEASDQRIIIRILEQGSFASGEDVIQPSFVPVIQKIGRILQKLPGKIIVAGHTDDVPIYTARFRSNWELSAARAVSVTQYLLDSGHLNQKRLTVSGYADTQPIFKNDTKEHRAHNRRVEIEVIQNSVDENRALANTLEEQKAQKVLYRAAKPKIQSSAKPKAPNPAKKLEQNVPQSTYTPLELFKSHFNGGEN